MNINKPVFSHISISIFIPALAIIYLHYFSTFSEFSNLETLLGFYTGIISFPFSILALIPFGVYLAYGLSIYIRILISLKLEKKFKENLFLSLFYESILSIALTFTGLIIMLLSRY
jgi:hypothetical protein